MDNTNRTQESEVLDCLLSAHQTHDVVKNRNLAGADRQGSCGTAKTLMAMRRSLRGGRHKQGQLTDVTGPGVVVDVGQQEGKHA
ncbi:hypothetical protein NL676_012274 [Syzygium grande]|nr:hypothetical protein NL676_012274 [Syzygium grande]